MAVRSTKDVVYLRKLVAGLGESTSEATQLSSDSKSARDVSYNPEHHDKMKHAERRHYFVRDMWYREARDRSAIRAYVRQCRRLLHQADEERESFLFLPSEDHEWA
jgi:hypothetical protein